jgi:SNW domain-containing protein 1
MQVAKKSDPAFLCSAALKKVDNDTFVRYTPTSNTNSGIQRIVQISNVVEDPLEPPRHKHKKIAGGAGDEPPPVIKRSPPRRLTAQDAKDWAVPASISNWKNANGYTIPLHMRL